MKASAYRRPFPGEAPIPLSVNYKLTKHPESELPDHLHDHYELVYVHEGSGKFFIDRTLYDKLPGDLFLIPGNTIHQAFPDADRPIVSTAVFFAPALVAGDVFDDRYSLLRCFESARKRKSYRHVLPSPIREKVLSSLDRIHAEMSNKPPGFCTAGRLALCDMLLELDRGLGFPSSEQQPELDDRSGPAWLLESLRAIDDNLRGPVGLSELASRAAVSPPHFSRVFKSWTGMNVTDYVNAKRVIRAKELLLQTDHGMHVIAEECGFDSLPHFHRIFRSLAGMTPGQFRKHQ
ncbi:AraC family transcriptional regulator [Paenibacillus soyae]|uniref:AraC family transcriptional regulator n=1 Tax=Paenibacillus soyae TaxID=2969249 RepID=A0A9X2MQ75_9BACL|nr:AraC family transcriptional regulator [Paenibacillus soyae]MCR2803853.1 AraC family transcriptional regulator [Paenibacillus soyae]